MSLEKRYNFNSLIALCVSNCHSIEYQKGEELILPPVRVKSLR